MIIYESKGLSKGLIVFGSILLLMYALFNLVLALLIISITIIAVGLLFWFKPRKRVIIQGDTLKINSSHRNFEGDLDLKWVTSVKIKRCNFFSDSPGVADLLIFEVGEPISMRSNSHIKLIFGAFEKVNYNLAQQECIAIWVIPKLAVSNLELLSLIESKCERPN